MKIDIGNDEKLTKFNSTSEENNLIQRENEERLALASSTSETLSLLNISITDLPQRCQELLHKCASLHIELDTSCDPLATSVRHTQELSQTMIEEYELLVLRQQNAKLRMQIERNKVFIEELKRELKSSKESLSSQNPNPGNLPEHMRQVKQKLISYEDVYEKSKSHFTKLHVPSEAFPQSLVSVAESLCALRQQEEQLRARADDVTLARAARHTLHLLRANKNT